MTGVSQFLIPLLAALGNLTLGAVVLFRGPRLELNRTFAFTTLTVVFWNLNIFSFYAFSEIDTAFYWSRFFRVGTLLMPAAVLHFFFVFSEYRARWIWHFLILAYAVSTLLVLANAGDLLVEELRRHPFGFYYVRTHLYGVFTALSIACALLTFLLLLVQCFSSKSPRKRFQARLWLLGISIAIPFGLTNLFLEPGGRIPPLGNLANTVYVALIAYSIVRHRLLDFDVVITKGMAYVAVSSIIIAPSYVLLLWLQHLSFGQVHVDFSIAVLLVVLAVGLLFPGLRLRAEAKIERSLFRDKHEYRANLAAFAQSIVRILDEEALIKELTDTLSRTLRLECVAIAILDRDGRRYVLRSPLDRVPGAFEFDMEDPLVQLLQSRKSAIVLNELEVRNRDPREAAVVDLLQGERWQVCLPLLAGGLLTGFIALGRKESLDEFSAGDLDLLETIGVEASIALENARLYRELKRSQEIIRRADRLSALGTLAAGIAHEIRNPLVSIQTFFQLAPERLYDEEFMTSFLKLTEEEVGRICGLITELLNFAKSPVQSRSEVRVEEEIERVLTLLAPEARKGGVRLERGPETKDARIYGDADQVRQVLINLVLNAVQASSDGGRITITVREVQQGGVGYCQIEVEDTGQGISEELREEIFNPFFTTKTKGTGLGLSIAHQIVREHGGFISVESKVGKGARFFVHMPLGANDPGQAGEQSSERRFAS